MLLLAAFEAKDALPALLDLLDRGTLGYDERGAIARALGELADARHALQLDAGCDLDRG